MRRLDKLAWPIALVLSCLYFSLLFGQRPGFILPSASFAESCPGGATNSLQKNDGSGGCAGAAVSDNGTKITATEAVAGVSAAWTGSDSAASYLTATACANGSSPATCGAAAAGSVAIPTGATSVTLVVDSSAVTASSTILVTPDETATISGVTCNTTLADLVGGLAVTARSAGTSFSVTYSGTVTTHPVCVDYLIIN